MSEKNVETPNDETEVKKRRKLPRVVVIAIVALAAIVCFFAVFFVIDLHEFITEERYRERPMEVDGPLGEPYIDQGIYGITDGAQADGAQADGVAPAVPILVEGDYTEAQMSVDFSFSLQHNKTYFAIDGKPVDVPLNGRVSKISFNLDHSKAILADVSPGLQVISADGIKKLGGASIKFAAISPSGNKGLYADFDHTCIFDINTGEVLESIGNDEEVSAAYFSPDENTVVYNGKADDSTMYPDDPNSFAAGSEYNLKIYQGGEEKVIEDAQSLSTSNNGEFVYYFKPSDGTLYVINAQSGITTKLGDIQITENGMPEYHPTFNRDSTEMIYLANDGIYYVEKNAQPQKLSDSKVTAAEMIRPQGAANYEVQFDESYRSFVKPYSKGSSSLKDKVYMFNGELVYLDGSLTTTQISDSCMYPQMSADGQTLYYIERSVLYRASAGAQARPQKMAEQVSRFALSHDQQQIYIVDKDRNLVYLGAGDEYKVVARDCSEDPAFVMLDNSRLYYSTAPVATANAAAGATAGAEGSTTLSELYYTQNGEEGVQVAYGLCAKPKVSSSTGRSMLFFLGTSGREVYVIGVNDPVPTKLYGAPDYSDFEIVEPVKPAGATEAATELAAP